MDTTHLKRRRQTWYARHTIPPSLQGVLGRSEFVRSLGTRDLREANHRKHAVLAEMQREITQAAFRATLPEGSAEFVLAVAERQRVAVERGRTSESAAQLKLDALVNRHLRSQQAKSVARTPNVPVPEARERALRLAHRVLHGEDVAPLRMLVKTYLAELQAQVRNQTAREKERHLGALANWLKTDCEVTAITRRLAGRYMTEELTQKGHAPKTIKDTLSHLSAFWGWLEGRGYVEGNPWRGMSRTVKVSTRGTALSRRAWTNAELLHLHQQLPKGDPVFALAALATYTGMRREEIAQLRVTDVDNNVVIVRQGKSVAARRVVPVHPVIQPLVAALVERSTDGFLLPGLLTGGADDKRGHYLGKRFGNMIRSAGVTDPALVFHTLRNSFIQRCEENGVPESTAKLLVGHSRWSSITYGNAGASYSPGVQLDTLRGEINKVCFGELDDFVKAIGGEIKIEHESRRRAR